MGAPLSSRETYPHAAELTGQVQGRLPRVVHHARVGLVLQQHLRLRGPQSGQAQRVHQAHTAPGTLPPLRWTSPRHSDRAGLPGGGGCGPRPMGCSPPSPPLAPASWAPSDPARPHSAVAACLGAGRGHWELASVRAHPSPPGHGSHEDLPRPSLRPWADFSHGTTPVSGNPDLSHPPLAPRLPTGLAFVVLDVHSSLGFQQQRDQFCVAIQGRMVQGREARAGDKHMWERTRAPSLPQGPAPDAQTGMSLA